MRLDMSGANSWDWMRRIGHRPPPSMRAADADREAAGAALRRHYAEGRISTDELSERLDHTYRAKTYGDLDVAFADLPPRPAPVAPMPAGPAPARRHSSPVLVCAVAVALVVTAFSAVVSAHALWLLWVLLWLAFARSRRWSLARRRRRPTWYL